MRDGANEMTVASPCINICQMDQTTGLCRGCFRTLDEIARWSSMDERDRASVVNALAVRRGGRAARNYPEHGSLSSRENE